MKAILLLFLILFSLNGYAAEPCLTAECAAFQSAIEAEQEAEELEDRAIKFKKTAKIHANRIEILKDRYKSPSFYRRVMLRKHLLNRIRHSEQFYIWSIEQAIEAENQAREARLWAKELSKRSQGSN